MEIKPINFKDIRNNDTVVIYEYNGDDIVPAIHDIKIKSIEIIESFTDDNDEDIIKINDTNGNSYFLTNNIDFIFNDLEDAYTYILSKIWKDLNYIQKCSILHELLSEELWIYRIVDKNENVITFDGRNGELINSYMYEYDVDKFNLKTIHGTIIKIFDIGKNYLFDIKNDRN